MSPGSHGHLLSAVLGASLAISACAGAAAPPAGEARMPAGECAAAAVDAAGRNGGEDVAWLVHSAQSDRYELDRWCRGVGAPVIASAGDSVTRVDSIPVITWNIHVGAARVDAFVDALRTGGITGRPEPHFVLLLQEARRTSAGVPAPLPGEARAARRLGQREPGPESDIVATAHRLGLDLFYVPSMRNGGRSDPPEDRGNAIMSTLPLTAHTAIELPLLAQRRVAVAATLSLADAEGRPRRLRVSSVHLDLGASASRPLAPFGPGRALQAGALAAALAGPGSVVVGGDFNTWSLPRLETAMDLMEAAFPDFPEGRREATFHTAGVWPRRLDHLFLRGHDAAGSAPDRIDDRWGSDHFPVMAWVRFEPW